ncbi:MAG: hypothetical protein ACI8S6_005723 [Myxococcota bacterium]|jgi:hypothetical protein
MKRVSAVGLSMALFSIACQSSLTGNEGNFQFSYDADDRVTDFNKPIAVGASLDLEVRDVGAQQPVNLTEASTDDPGVIEVASFNDHELTVTATGEGFARLQVAGTTADGEDLTDSVNLMASVPEVHLLWHTCDPTGQGAAGYLTGQRVWLPFELEMSNGQPVIGYGYYPVAFDGAPVLTVNSADSTQQHMAADIGDTPGELTMTSDVDGSSLSMLIAEPGQIDGVAEPIAFVLEDIDVGDVNSFYTLPTVGDIVLCQAEVTKTVQSDTPDICDVRDRDPADPSAYEYGWFEVEGIAQGTCTYTVTYPDGSGGQGASASFSYTIEP